MSPSTSTHAERWCIFYRDMTEAEAAQFPRSFARVLQLVKPVKEVKGGASAKYWWRFYRYSPQLYDAISHCQTVFVTTMVTKHLCFSAVDANQVFTNRLAVVAKDDWAVFTLLQSSHHELWARQFSTTLETRLCYTPTDCFLTFPFPASGVDQQKLREVGHSYHQHRSELMISLNEGLTKMYNLFHDAGEASEGVARLRVLHVEMDQAVAAAYGWGDLDLGHGFHTTKQGIRYTISEFAHRIVLDRLLALNNERHAEETRAGTREKSNGRRRAKAKGRALSLRADFLD